MTVDPDLAGGRLTIDLNALVSNWRMLGEQARSAECAAVVKANAYGCGIEPVVAALSEAGCKTFFVAMPQEGLRAKQAAPSARCFVLNGLFESAVQTYADAGLVPILGSLEEIAIWARFASQSGARQPCAIHFDSGMTRLGLSLDDLQTFAGNADLMGPLDIQLFMTHYACADDVGHPQTLQQKQNFKEAAKLLPGVPRSAANSAADLQMNGHEFELVRPGVALYGGEALNDTPNPMQQVAKLEARIVQIRDAKAGDPVGYGAAEVLSRDTRIAYVSVGYADGYFRAASNAGVAMRKIAPPAVAAYRRQIIKGIGRISMDLSAFDVTDIPQSQIAPGSWIELFGDAVHVDDVARAAGTIGYELLTGLGNRYARTYVGGDG